MLNILEIADKFLLHSSALESLKCLINVILCRYKKNDSSIFLSNGGSIKTFFKSTQTQNALKNLREMHEIRLQNISFIRPREWAVKN